MRKIISHLKRVKNDRLIGVLMFLFAFGLTESEFYEGVGIYGIALCIGCNIYTLPVFAGVFSGNIIQGTEGCPGALLAMAVYGSKWLFARKKRQPPKWFTTLLSLLCTGFTIGWGIYKGSVVFSSLVRASFTFSVIPIFGFFFSQTVPFLPEVNKKSLVLQEVSVIGWIFAISKAIGFYSFFGIRFDIIAGGICTLYYGRKSPFFGGMCGFAAGLACGLVYIPMLTVYGMAFGIFASDIPWFALIFSTLLSVTSGVYLVTFENAFPEFFNLTVSSAIFGLIWNYLPKIENRENSEPKSPEKLHRLCAAFACLSESFQCENSAEITKPELSVKLKSDLFMKCDRCKSYCRCKIDKYDYVNHLTELAFRNINLPDYIKRGCPNAGALSAEAINGVRMGSLRTESISDAYNSVARLLSSAESYSADEGINTELTEKCASAFAKEKISFESLTIRGKRIPKLYVTGVTPSEIKQSPDKLKKLLLSAAGCMFSSPEFRKTAVGWDMVMTALPYLRIDYGKAAACKTDESVCGDTAVAFESENKKFYSLLSDGMGSGNDAAVSSRLASLFLEKMLLAGGSKKECLNMLNNLLLNRKSEVFTTVDLLEIDRMTGEAMLIKAGSAPTYICRGSRKWKIESNTPPIGVIGNMKVTQTTINLRRGDVIIMTSDGIETDGSELAYNWKNTASFYASDILNCHTSAINPDDMSVCVVKAM